MMPKYNGMDGKNFYPESPFHKNKLIASGKTDRFKPLFSYHGFRYVLIEGLKKPLKECDITAIFLHQNVARRSDFHTGNELINYIYNAGIRSTYSNLFWSLTDCSTREKLGWANDAQATTEQILINFDIVPLFEKWFEDLKSSMRPDGSLPGIIPSPDWGFNYGPLCGRPEFAYRLITESKPGYRTWFEQGATTLWESWDCDRRGGSKNHHMFSNVIAWFYKSFLGIAPQEDFPGFEQINLRPCFIKELGFAEGAMETVRGRIEVRWIFENDRFIYTVTVPEGIRAIFRGKTLSVGRNEFIIRQEEALL